MYRTHQVLPCNFRWGSHSCDVETREYHEFHICGTVRAGLCSQYDEKEKRVRFYRNGDWGPWAPSRAGHHQR